MCCIKVKFPHFELFRLKIRFGGTFRTKAAVTLTNRPVIAIKCRCMAYGVVSENFARFPGNHREERPSVGSIGLSDCATCYGSEVYASSMITARENMPTNSCTRSVRSLYRVKCHG
jgi:hypothetical protein